MITKPTHVDVIAEIGSVHDGSFGNACKLIDLAAECGADAVKFQTHIAEAESTHDAPAPAYFSAEPRMAYFRRTGFTQPQWVQLKAHAASRKIEFLSSPFSEEAVDLLESIGMTRYKIPSGEVTNLPLLQRIARTGKPVILSSGMNSWTELDQAVAAVRAGGAPFSVMQCTSEYPCPYERVGLNVMREMARRYECPVGLSDHTLTSFATLAAVSHGATVIEKHLTFSRKMYGSDAQHSMEPSEFTQMVQGIRAISTMLASDVDKDDLGKLGSMKKIFEKSVVARHEIPAGTTITAAMLTVKKPGTGIPARELQSVVGTVAARTIAADSLLKPEDLAKA